MRNVFLLCTVYQGDTMERWRTEPYIMITGSGRYGAHCCCLPGIWKAEVGVSAPLHACIDYALDLH